VAFLPLAAGIAVSAGAANTRLVPRFGARPLVPLGMLIAAGGMFWLSHLGVGSTYGGAVVGPLLILGAGVGLTFAPAIASATAGVSDADAGVASAMVNTSQQIGGAVGTAALSTIFLGAVTRYVTTHRPPTPVVRDAAAIHGYGVAFSVSCGLFLAGMVLTALLLRSGRPETHQRPRDASRRLDQPADRSDEDTQPNRIAELLDRGINREAVDMILDLELRITQLEA